MKFDYKTILFASGNLGKLAEVREQVVKYSIKILSPDDLAKMRNLKIPTQVVEDALTYEGNAKLKADQLHVWSLGMPTLSDDSGLEVNALDGEPGVNTARYAGEKSTGQDNINKLLKALDGIENRQARFVCHLCLKGSANEYITASSELIGEISKIAYGKGGFGYDPIFIPQGYNVTLAELKEKGIQVATHRIKALNLLFTSN